MAWYMICTETNMSFIDYLRNLDFPRLNVLYSILDRYILDESYALAKYDFKLIREYMETLCLVTSECVSYLLHCTKGKWKEVPEMEDIRNSPFAVVRWETIPNEDNDLDIENMYFSRDHVFVLLNHRGWWYRIQSFYYSASDKSRTMIELVNLDEITKSMVHQQQLVFVPEGFVLDVNLVKERVSELYALERERDSISDEYACYL